MPSAVTHYGDPISGCLPDELKNTVGGAAFCSAPCKNRHLGWCPPDVPAGVMATPSCMVRDPIGAGYHCALACSADAECAAGSACNTVYGTPGFCAYAASPSPPSYGPCGPSDDRTSCAVLQKLFNATDQKLHWRMDGLTSLCAWQGVSCKNVGDTRPTDLVLSDLNLTGTVPAQLGDLKSLIRLNLSTNRLSGTIPPSIGLVSALTTLQLDNNVFAGSLPTELGRLSRLQHFDASHGVIVGTIPTQVGQLSSLVQLNLDFNSLSGTIPSLAHLSHLTTILLSCNHLASPLPGSLEPILHSVVACDLSYNDFSSDPLPEWVLDVGMCKADRAGSCSRSLTLESSVERANTNLSYYESPV